MKKRTIGLLIIIITITAMIACGTKVTPTCEHTYGPWEIITTADCITNGEQVHICTLCGYNESEVINAVGHKEEIVSAVEATCTESGLSEGKVCSVCNVVLIDQETIVPLGHLEESIPEVAATCTEDGSTGGKKCSVCQEILETPTIIDATGHNIVEVDAIAATCTTAGMSKGTKCLECGEVLTATTEVQPLGHNYYNGICTRCKTKHPAYIKIDCAPQIVKFYDGNTFEIKLNYYNIVSGESFLCQNEYRFYFDIKPIDIVTSVAGYNAIYTLIDDNGEKNSAIDTIDKCFNKSLFVPIGRLNDTTSSFEQAWSVDDLDLLLTDNEHHTYNMIFYNEN